MLRLAFTFGLAVILAMTGLGVSQPAHAAVNANGLFVGQWTATAWGVPWGFTIDANGVATVDRPRPCWEVGDVIFTIEQTTFNAGTGTRFPGPSCDADEKSGTFSLSASSTTNRLNLWFDGSSWYRDVEPYQCANGPMPVGDVLQYASHLVGTGIGAAQIQAFTEDPCFEPVGAGLLSSTYEDLESEPMAGAEGGYASCRRAKDTVALYTRTTRFTTHKIATYEMWTDFCWANGIVFKKNTGGAERPAAAIIANAQPASWAETAFAVKYVGVDTAGIATTDATFNGNERGAFCTTISTIWSGGIPIFGGEQESITKSQCVYSNGQSRIRNL